MRKRKGPVIPDVARGEERALRMFIIFFDVDDEGRKEGGSAV